MKECTGKEITEEWLYHLGVPVDQIEDMAENSAVCVPTMMPYITAFFMPRRKGDSLPIHQEILYLLLNIP